MLRRGEGDASCAIDDGSAVVEPPAVVEWPDLVC